MSDTRDPVELARTVMAYEEWAEITAANNEAPGPAPDIGMDYDDVPPILAAAVLSQSARIAQLEEGLREACRIGKEWAECMYAYDSSEQAARADVRKLEEFRQLLDGAK